MSQSVSLTAQQQELVDRLLASGRFHGASDVISASLRLLAERENAAADFVAELEAEIAIGLRSASGPMETSEALVAQFRSRQ